MGIGAWLSHNWFEFFSVLGIVASLLFTAASMRADTKTRQVANLLAITANHREIWKEFFRNPELSRVLDVAANLKKQPATHGEEMFVNLVLQHISSVYYATADQLVIEVEGLRRDISQFLSLPIPRAVWEKWKVMQNDDVVAFIEDSRRSK